MKKTAARKSIIGALDSASASRLVQAASDLTLVLNEQGLVLSVTLQDPDLPTSIVKHWQGKSWAATATPDSRQKIETLLAEAPSTDAAPRWRQVNHVLPTGEDLPVQYTALRLLPTTSVDAAATSSENAATSKDRHDASESRIVAFGRSLRSMVLLQQRLVESQQAMERDYWRFREAETRYRHLFQTSGEAVLIVDALAQKILEVNPAAQSLCGPAGKLQGSGLASIFQTGSVPELQALLSAARTVGRKEPIRALLVSSDVEVSVSASVFRQDDNTFVLLRLVPVPVLKRAGKKLVLPGHASDATEASPTSPLAMSFMKTASDAIVFTDLHGRVLDFNPAFSALAQIAGEVQIVGQMLDRWVGRTGVELAVLISNLRLRGSSGLFVTAVRGELGVVTAVEIAASVLGSAPGSAVAFTIRNVERRLKSEAAGGTAVTRSVGDLTDLVGNVPLKDIVSETTDLIEQLCIETALSMTGDKRSSAALLLGLSRQSLYVKLRRFGLADQNTEEQI